MNARDGISLFWLTLETEGIHGFFYGLEGTYLGLLPAIFLYRFINKYFFYSKQQYNNIIKDLDLLDLPHLRDPLRIDDDDDDDWEDIWEDEDEDEGEAEDEDEGEDEDGETDEEDEEFDGPGEIVLDIHRELDELEDMLDEQIEDEVLLQVERCLARMKRKHWKEFLRIGGRAFVTRTCAKLGMKLSCYPGDVLGKVMQREHVCLRDAASMVYNKQGLWGFFRGASIEFFLVPLQIGAEMAITVCAIRYNWGGKLYSFLFPGLETPMTVIDRMSRPSPGKN
eukprot:CAMPEP_0117050790 /NCGR_PEP_ID=MMETSP0472-20121206/35073_1 /TAXON_ID=693140 ORGANISM="Tiarina fusus, Strain LIS" /NCGR_SAMPLE_ID=MMETSP0472 /ASSEMBLY_ACC=CAM_ASM_000603 /LENGTH=280 /DNA_ID=CAMNT_0004764717 /DNA_START=265 /DNA_END=1107 /DNA_ORIENTATION=-